MSFEPTYDQTTPQSSHCLEVPSPQEEKSSMPLPFFVFFFFSVPAKMAGVNKPNEHKFYTSACIGTKGKECDPRPSVTRAGSTPYHLRPMPCCILAGETEGGGLDIVMPVAGLTMGMALRARVAAGWWSFKLDCWYAGGMKAGEEELSENPGATVWGCCVGEDSGELLARDERSEELWMEFICSGRHILVTGS